MTRHYFGTDGVRGVVGDTLTADLVERLGRAATIWVGGGAVLVGRDTRGSGPELERALARGIVSAGGDAVLGGVLPTPAVALCARDLGAVVSASHNPPEYNGVKLFDRDGAKLTDEAEEEIESFLDEPPIMTGLVERDGSVSARYREHVLDHFGTDLSALRIAVDGDGARMLAVDAQGDSIDGDQILAILAVHLGVDFVAVTAMTNIGFHKLMADRGIRVVTTDVGDRYVLEALRREGGVLGGEQSGHLIYLHDHVTGDGLAAALLVCAALQGRSLADAVAVMPRYPQVKENVRVGRRELTTELREAIEERNA